MLGQYRILSEVLLFTLGVAITSFVILSFQNVREYITQSSVENQLESVSSLVSSSVVKVSGRNSAISLRIPDKLSEMDYRIYADCDETKCAIIAATLNSFASSSKQIFNMGLDNIISGDVPSASRYVEVASLSSTPKNTVEIRRQR